MGVNRYSPGDALITGSTGDRWSVSRDRFDAKYDPEPPTLRGDAGNYRNRPAIVLTKRSTRSFTVAGRPAVIAYTAALATGLSSTLRGTTGSSKAQRLARLPADGRGELLTQLFYRRSSPMRSLARVRYRDQVLTH